MKSNKVTLILLFLLCFSSILNSFDLSPSVQAAGYVTRTVTVTNSSGSAQTNYPIDAVLSTSAEITAGRMQTDCGDVRVFASDFVSPLDYAVFYCNTTYTSVVFKVPSLPTGTSTYYITFGDPSLINAENPSQVFDIYEMFTTTPSCSLAGATNWDGVNQWLQLTPNTASATGSCNYTYTPANSRYLVFFQLWSGGTNNGTEAMWQYGFDSQVPANEDIVLGGAHFTFDDGQNRVCYTTQTDPGGVGACNTAFAINTLDNSTWRNIKLSWDTTRRRISIDGVLRVNNTAGATPTFTNPNFGFKSRNGTVPNERRIRQLAVTTFNETITNTVSATNIAPLRSLSFALRNSGDTAAFSGLCDFGDLSINTVGSCAYRLKVTTNSRSGYTINITTSGDLRTSDGLGFPNALAGSNGSGGSNIAASSNLYGASITPGSCTNGQIIIQPAFNPSPGNSVAINQASSTPVLGCNGPNQPGTTDLTNTTLINLQIARSSDTPAGFYSQTITWTLAPNF